MSRELQTDGQNTEFAMNSQTSSLQTTDPIVPVHVSSVLQSACKYMFSIFLYLPWVPSRLATASRLSPPARLALDLPAKDAA